MAKRFIDTEIWKRPWFRKLKPAEKCAFRYILENCDSVGVWIPDEESAEYFIGEKVDWDLLVEGSNGNIERLESGKWWLPDFCRFQYGTLDENTKDRPRLSYIRLLKDHGLWKREGVSKGLVSPLQGAKNKNKTRTRLDKEKEQEKEKDSQGASKGQGPDPADFAEEVVALLEPYHDRAASFVRENRRELIDLAARDGRKVVRGALLICVNSRIAKLEYFVKDYSGYRQKYVREKAEAEKDARATDRKLRQQREDGNEARESYDKNASLKGLFDKETAGDGQARASPEAEEERISEVEEEVKPDGR